MRSGRRKNKRDEVEMPDMTLEQAVALALDQNLSFEMGIFSFRMGRTSCSMTKAGFDGLLGVEHYFERFEKAKSSLKLKKISLHVRATLVGNWGLVLRTQPPAKNVSRVFTSIHEFRKWLGTSEGQDCQHSHTTRWIFSFER